MRTNAPWLGGELTRPITAERPCGDSLEDTALLASFDEFRLFGHSTPLDPEPDWAEVESRSLGALARSKDLRVLAHLAAAAVRIHGLPGFASAVTAAASWLETTWPDTYPQIDDDAVLRRNALNCFADRMAVVEALRRLTLADSRQHGRFSLRDIETATGGAGDEAPREDERISAAFATMPVDELQAMAQQVVRARTAVNAIDRRMRDEAGEDGAPMFEPLQVTLARMGQVIALHLDGRDVHRQEGGQVAAPSESDAPMASVRPVGRVRSREDATQALDDVAAFFRRSEPSSPIPLLLDRAKRLVSKDFLEVLADIAPDALTQARATGGLSRE